MISSRSMLLRSKLNAARKTTQSSVRRISIPSNASSKTPSSSQKLRPSTPISLRTSSSFRRKGIHYLAANTNIGNGSSTRSDIQLHPFSTQSDGKQEKDSLRDTVNKIQGKQEEESSSSKDEQDTNTNDNEKSDKVLSDLQTRWSSFQGSLSDTWNELVDSSKPKEINKKIAKPKDDQGIKYQGTADLMVIDENEHLTAWEKMQRRLTDAPIIQDILSKTDIVLEKSGANQAKTRLSEIKEDAQETWETSQNPWVYRISSVYDTLTAESEFAAAVRQLRTLDPDFTLEEFQHNAVEITLPKIMKMVLRGEIDELEPWLGEAVHNRLSAEIKHREKEGLVLDDNVLGIFNADIVAAEIPPKQTEPILVMHYMCQQINCSRDKDGNVKEGREDEIKANSYLTAFQREYNEDDGTLNWKIVDFRFNGAIAWI